MLQAAAAEPAEPAAAVVVQMTAPEAAAAVAAGDAAPVGQSAAGRRRPRRRALAGALRATEPAADAERPGRRRREPTAAVAEAAATEAAPADEGATSRGRRRGARRARPGRGARRARPGRTRRPPRRPPPRPPRRDQPRPPRPPPRPPPPRRLPPRSRPPRRSPRARRPSSPRRPRSPSSPSSSRRRPRRRCPAALLELSAATLAGASQIEPVLSFSAPATLPASGGTGASGDEAAGATELPGAIGGDLGIAAAELTVADPTDPADSELPALPQAAGIVTAPSGASTGSGPAPGASGPGDDPSDADAGAGDLLAAEAHTTVLTSTEFDTAAPRGPPAPGASFISALAGGTVTVGTATLTFAPGALPADAYVLVTVTSTPVNGLVTASPVFELTAHDAATGELIETFLIDPQLTIHVGAGLAIAPRITYVDPVTGPEALASTYDAVAGTVTASLAHFSAYTSTFAPESTMPSAWTITLSGGVDVVTVSISGGNVVVTIDDLAPLTRAIADLTSLTIVGESDDDRFVLDVAGLTIPITITGGGLLDSDTLVAPDVANLWTLSGLNAGTLTPAGTSAHHLHEHREHHGRLGGRQLPARQPRVRDRHDRRRRRAARDPRRLVLPLPRRRELRQRHRDGHAPEPPPRRPRSA